MKIVRFFQNHIRQILGLGLPISTIQVCSYQISHWPIPIAHIYLKYLFKCLLLIASVENSNAGNKLISVFH